MGSFSAQGSQNAQVKKKFFRSYREESIKESNFSINSREVKLDETES